MNVIDKAIADSREREAKATKGPWRNPEVPQITDLPFDEAIQAGVEQGHEVNYGDIVFCAASRTWEPRFRDALEVAVAGMEAELQRAGGMIPILKKTLEEISRILSGAAEEGGEK